MTQIFNNLLLSSILLIFCKSLYSILIFSNLLSTILSIDTNSTTITANTSTTSTTLIILNNVTVNSNETVVVVAAQPPITNSANNNDNVNYGNNDSKNFQYFHYGKYLTNKSTSESESESNALIKLKQNIQNILVRPKNKSSYYHNENTNNDNEKMIILSNEIVYNNAANDKYDNTNNESNFLSLKKINKNHFDDNKIDHYEKQKQQQQQQQQQYQHQLQLQQQLQQQQKNTNDNNNNDNDEKNNKQMSKKLMTANINEYNDENNNDQNNNHDESLMKQTRKELTYFKLSSSLFDQNKLFKEKIAKIHVQNKNLRISKQKRKKSKRRKRTQSLQHSSSLPLLLLLSSSSLPTFNQTSSTITTTKAMTVVKANQNQNHHHSITESNVNSIIINNDDDNNGNNSHSNSNNNDDDHWIENSISSPSTSSTLSSTKYDLDQTNYADNLNFPFPSMTSSSFPFSSIIKNNNNNANFNDKNTNNSESNDDYYYNNTNDNNANNRINNNEFQKLFIDNIVSILFDDGNVMNIVTDNDVDVDDDDGSDDKNQNQNGTKSNNENLINDNVERIMLMMMTGTAIEKQQQQQRQQSNEKLIKMVKIMLKKICMQSLRHQHQHQQEHDKKNQFEYGEIQTNKTNLNNQTTIENENENGKIIIMIKGKKGTEINESGHMILSNVMKKKWPTFSSMKYIEQQQQLLSSNYSLLLSSLVLLLNENGEINDNFNNNNKNNNVVANICRHLKHQQQQQQTQLQKQHRQIMSKQYQNHPMNKIETNNNNNNNKMNELISGNATMNITKSIKDQHFNVDEHKTNNNNVNKNKNINNNNNAKTKMMIKNNELIENNSIISTEMMAKHEISSSISTKTATTTTLVKRMINQKMMMNDENNIVNQQQNIDDNNNQIDFVQKFINKNKNSNTNDHIQNQLITFEHIINNNNNNDDDDDNNNLNKLRQQQQHQQQQKQNHNLNEHVDMNFIHFINETDYKQNNINLFRQKNISNNNNNNNNNNSVEDNILLTKLNNSNKFMMKYNIKSNLNNNNNNTNNSNNNNSSNDGKLYYHIDNNNNNNLIEKNMPTSANLLLNNNNNQEQQQQQLLLLLLKPKINMNINDYNNKTNKWSSNHQTDHQNDNLMKLNENGTNMNYQTNNAKMKNHSLTVNINDLNEINFVENVNSSSSHDKNTSMNQNLTYFNNNNDNENQNNFNHLSIEKFLPTSSIMLTNESMPEAFSTLKNFSSLLLLKHKYPFITEKQQEKFDINNKNNVSIKTTLTPMNIVKQSKSKQAEQKSLEIIEYIANKHLNLSLFKSNTNNITISNVNNRINDDEKIGNINNNDHEKKSINSRHVLNNQNQLHQQQQQPRQQQILSENLSSNKLMTANENMTINMNRCLSTTDRIDSNVQCNRTDLNLNNNEKNEKNSTKVESYSISSGMTNENYNKSAKSNIHSSSISNVTFSNVTPKIYNEKSNQLNRKPLSSSSTFCPIVHDSKNNIIWPSTDLGIMSVQPCPSNEYYGTMFRFCGHSNISSDQQQQTTAKWSKPDMNECRLIKLRQLNYLVNQHSRKHLIDSLFLFIIELKNLLIKNQMHNQQDYYNTLKIFNLILKQMNEHKIRFDRYDYEQKRMMINFIQSTIIITDRLFDTIIQPINHQNHNIKNINNIDHNNKSITTELLLLIQSMRLLMDNVLRAFILACQDGSIQHLNMIFAMYRPFFPATKNLEINLRYQKQNEPKLLITLIKTNETIDFDVMCNKLSSPSMSSSSSTSSKSLPSSTSIDPYMQESSLNILPSTIIVNGMNELDVGVTEIWFKNIFDKIIQPSMIEDDSNNYDDFDDFDNFNNNDNDENQRKNRSKLKSLTKTTIINKSNHIISISLVPAVSIQVNFEVVPCFEVVFHFHHDQNDSENFHHHHNGKYMRKNSTENSLKNDETIIEKLNTTNNNSNNDDTYDKNNNKINKTTNFDTNIIKNSDDDYVDDESIITNTNKSLSINKIQFDTIQCAQLIISHRKQPLWTINNGCRTVDYNGTHLRCLCNESGLIGAVIRHTVLIDYDNNDINENSENNNNNNNKEFYDADNVNYENNNLFIDSSNIDSSTILSSSSSSLSSTTTISTAENYYNYYNNHHNNVSARIIRSSGFHMSTGTMAPSSHHLFYDIVLYTSFIMSVIFFSLTLIIQYRLRHYETRETFFIIRNLIISLLLIQLTFLLGTTIHMDLFWIRVEQLSTGFEQTALSNQIKHILCLSVPIFLHFIHLASMFWMLSYTILLYQRMWRRHKGSSSSSSSSTTTTSNELETNKSINSQNFSDSNINNDNNNKLHTKRRRNSIKNSSSLSKNNDNRMTLNELSVFSHEYRRKFLKKLKTLNKHQFMMTNFNKETNSSNDMKRLQKTKSYNNNNNNNNEKCSIFKMIKQNIYKFHPKNLISKIKFNNNNKNRKNNNNNNTIFIRCSLENNNNSINNHSNSNNNNDYDYSLSKINVPFCSKYHHHHQQHQHCTTEMSIDDNHNNSYNNSNNREPSLSVDKKLSLSMNQKIKTNSPLRQKCSLSLSTSSSSASKSKNKQYNNNDNNEHSVQQRMQQKNNNVDDNNDNNHYHHHHHHDHNSQQQSKHNDNNIIIICLENLSLLSLFHYHHSIFITWNCIHYLCFSLGFPFIFVLLSYLLNSKGYETKRYCWMSIEGGIQYSFIIPVLLLLSLNTCLILLVLKRYFERKSLSNRLQIQQIRPSIRSCIILLPFFCLNWFLGVLSLETLRTTPFELIFALTNGLYSFLAFYFHCYQRYNLKYYFQQYGTLRLIFMDFMYDNSNSNSNNNNNNGGEFGGSNNQGIISKFITKYIHKWFPSIDDNLDDHYPDHLYHHNHHQHQYNHSEYTNDDCNDYDIDVKNNHLQQQQHQHYHHYHHHHHHHHSYSRYNHHHHHPHPYRHSGKNPNHLDSDVSELLLQKDSSMMLMSSDRLNYANNINDVNVDDDDTTGDNDRILSNCDKNVREIENNHQISTQNCQNSRIKANSYCNSDDNNDSLSSENIIHSMIETATVDDFSSQSLTALNRSLSFPTISSDHQPYSFIEHEQHEPQKQNNDSNCLIETVRSVSPTINLLETTIINPNKIIEQTTNAMPTKITSQLHSSHSCYYCHQCQQSINNVDDNLENTESSLPLLLHQQKQAINNGEYYPHHHLSSCLYSSSSQPFTSSTTISPVKLPTTSIPSSNSSSVYYHHHHQQQQQHYQPENFNEINIKDFLNFKNTDNNNISNKIFGSIDLDSTIEQRRQPKQILSTIENGFEIIANNNNNNNDNIIASNENDGKNKIINVDNDKNCGSLKNDDEIFETFFKSYGIYHNQRSNLNNFETMMAKNNKSRNQLTKIDFSLPSIDDNDDERNTNNDNNNSHSNLISSSSSNMNHCMSEDDEDEELIIIEIDDDDDEDDVDDEDADEDDDDDDDDDDDIDDDEDDDCTDEMHEFDYYGQNSPMTESF